MLGTNIAVLRWVFALAWVFAASAARAATPDGALFPFPGHPASPAAAASAGLALADRWLGDQPFDNPAFAGPRGLELSPALIHVSRQDLRAANRNYDETAGYLDGAGGWIALPLGRATLFAYGSQPVLRFEDNSFTRGTTAIDPANPPAMIRTQAEGREIRAGAGLSWGDSVFRLGAAWEWVRRDDHYQVIETSGSPLAGTTTTRFSGDGAGVQAGVHLGRGLSGPHPLTAGLGVRMLPAISLSARDTFEPLVPAVGDTVSYGVERGASWEGGLSARYGVNATFSMMAGAGAHGAQAWRGLGASTRAGQTWSIGGALHDPADPWSLRFGFGQEIEPGAPEPRAGLFGLGLGWNSEGTRIDAGVLRRSVQRGSRPTSYDDRVVVSVGVAF